ncbi:MAG: hypothetical protein NVSMB2_15260 [Chloroflexota bacterium]
MFLDRDGVLIEDVHFLQHIQQIKIVEEAVAALARLQTAFRLVVVTNQSGVARGLFDETTLAAINRAIAIQFAARGVQLDGIYYCPHHPDGPLAAYRQTCDCRKPQPGLLQRAASHWALDLERSYMIGDRQTDLDAGHAAGTQTIHIPPATRSHTWAQLVALHSQKGY